MVRVVAVTNVAAARVPKREWAAAPVGRAVVPMNAPIAGRDRVAIRGGRIAGRSKMAAGVRSLRRCRHPALTCSVPKAVGGVTGVCPPSMIGTGVLNGVAAIVI